MHSPNLPRASRLLALLLPFAALASTAQAQADVSAWGQFRLHSAWHREALAVQAEARRAGRS